MSNGKYILGGILILLGLSGLFNALGIGSYWDLLWPIIILIAGIYMVIKNKRNFGVFLILAGILFLVSNLLNTNAFSLFFPLLFIYLGATVFGIAPKFMKSGKASSDNSEDKGKESNDSLLDDMVIFGTNNKSVKSKSFMGGEIVSVFGGTKLYLTDAKIAEKGANLQVSAIFGAAEVIVPKDMNVVVKGSGVFGGWDDKTIPNELPDQH